MPTTLREALDQYGPDAFLLTMGADGPHTSHVSVAQDGQALICAIGKSAVRNIGVSPKVSLLWPPLENGGYSIVMNATAAIDESGAYAKASLELTKAVFHRAGKRPAGSEGPCPNDCKPISI